MRYLLLALFFFGIAACSVSKVSDTQDYQYDLISEMTWELGVVDSSLLPFMVLDGKVFEFIIYDHLQMKPLNDTVDLSDDKTIVKPKVKESDVERRWRDTLFVKVIDIKANKFVLLDRFTVDAAVVRRGNYDTSSLGTNFLRNVSQSGSISKAMPTKDTVINEIPLLYSNTTTYHDILKDSFVTSTFFTVDTLLLTPFSAIKCGEYDKQLAGYIAYTRDRKFVMGQRVGNIRKLSDANTAVCKAILKKIGW